MYRVPASLAKRAHNVLKRQISGSGHKPPSLDLLSFLVDAYRKKYEGGALQSQLLSSDDRAFLAQELKKALDREASGNTDRHERIKAAFDKWSNDADPRQLDTAMKRLNCHIGATNNVHGSWYPSYKVYVHLLLVYSSCLAGFWVLGWSSGMLTEIFFAKFINKTGSVFFLFLPFSTISLSYLVDEMYDIAKDCFKAPPLAYCRATLIAGLSDPNNLADCPTFLFNCMEVFTFMCIHVLPLVFLLISRAYTSFWEFWDLALFGSFVCGAVVGIGIIGCAFSCLDFIVLKNPQKMKYRDFIDHELRVRSVYPGYFNNHTDQLVESIQMGWAVHDKQLSPVEASWQEEEAAEADGRPSTPKTVVEGIKSIFMKLREPKGIKLVTLTLVKNMKEGILPWYTKTGVEIVFVPLAMWLIVHSVCFFLGPFEKLAAIFFVITVAAVSLVIKDKMPELIGPPYFAVLMFYVIVAFVLLTSSHLQQEQTWQAQSSTTQAWAQDSHDTTNNRYPVCDMKWGDLSSLDLAELAHIAYDTSDEHAINTKLKDNLGFDSARLVNLSTDAKAVPRWLQIRFGPDEKPGTQVFAIKGTSSHSDAVTDASLWGSIQVFQMLDMILPVLSFFPEEYIQWLLRPSFNSHAKEAENKIFKEIENAIGNMKDSKDKVVLTGHSLGGGIAQVVAARKGYPALVFSAPGIKYSTYRFAEGNHSVTKFFELVHPFQERARRNVVVIAPDNDVVPQVDRQLGMVQQIECRNYETARKGNHVECHSLLKTTCELVRVCGESRTRRKHGLCFYPFANSKNPKNPAEVFPW